MKLYAILLIAISVVAAGCGRHPADRAAARPELPAAPVRLQNVESKQRPTTEEVVGTVRAKLRATLEAKVSGRIEQMPVILGQRVKAGDLLAQLEGAEIKARLEQAEANLQQAQRDWNRVASLFEKNAMTQSERDNAESQLQVAKARVAEARAMIGYVRIVAPFEGVVTRKHADVGDLAQPGKPLLELEDPAALQLEADVPEAIAPRVGAGARLPVRADVLPAELTATVAEMAPSADPASRTIRVKLDLPASSGLRAGQFARLVVPIGENTALRVPVSAVVQRGQMEIVFVAHQQKAQMHLVKTGRRVGDEIEVLSGLDAGDAVVVEGASLLSDGQPLTTQ